MIKIEQQEIITKFKIVKDPQIYITGQSEDGSRQMIVRYDVKDDMGNDLQPIEERFIGKDFNKAYSTYVNDKALTEMIFESNGIEVDTTILESDFINPEITE